AEQTYPRSLHLPHTPPHEPAIGRMRNERVAGSVRVPHGSPWGRPKADGWPDVDNRWGNPPTSHRGNPEGQRSGQHRFNNPQPETAAISPKPRTPWGDDRFILTTNVRSVHRPRPSSIVHHRSGRRVRGFGVTSDGPEALRLLAERIEHGIERLFVHMTAHGPGHVADHGIGREVVMLAQRLDL